MNFSGRIAVVTGGASGIGAACAASLAAHGARVVVADRKPADSTAAQTVAIDVADENSVAAAVDEIESRIGPVQVLVNSAGVLQRTLPPEELGLAEWDFVARVDLRGTYLCCAAFGARMAARGAGAIVNIASVAGMRSGPLHSYGPAKAGVIHLSECLAAEWGPKGVRVNTVSPGFTQTPALDKGKADGTLNDATLSANTALGRLIRPEEIAAAVTFLASDLASAVTGANLPVDAGFLVATPWAAYGGLRRRER
ncbi:MAG: SDR family oxidoreductase [Betaproteobacteria bacterium]|nr:MAG: SDR family oxidoreductase [Betaproteobacteria bacterium]